MALQRTLTATNGPESQPGRSLGSFSPYDMGSQQAGLAMRVISLVTEGLERAAEVGGLDWLFAQDADIICLQDTRCAEHTLRGDAFPRALPPLLPGSL